MKNLRRVGHSHGQHNNSTIRTSSRMSSSADCVPLHPKHDRIRHRRTRKPSPYFLVLFLVVLMVVSDTFLIAHRGEHQSPQRMTMMVMTVEAFATPTTSSSKAPAKQSCRNPCYSSSSHFSSAIAATRSSSSSCNTILRSSLAFHEITTISLQWTEYFAPSPDNVPHPTNNSNKNTPVLLLHGLLGSKRNFSSLGRMLGVQLEKKRRVLGVDLRNHGDTVPHAEDMTYQSMAQDVIAFLNSQNIDKIVLVGHSMGGKVAQALALLYPERVEGLVVLDIAPVTYSREHDPHWKAVEDILHAIHYVVQTTTTTSGGSTASQVDQALQKSIPDPALRAFVLTNYDNRRQQWKIPIATLVEQLEHIAGFDIHHDDHDHDDENGTFYDGDVFIIHGGQSRFVRHAYMDAISSYFPNHMLTTVRGAGHWVHAEAPDDVTALLKRYLDR